MLLLITDFEFDNNYNIIILAVSNTKGKIKIDFRRQCAIEQLTLAPRHGFRPALLGWAGRIPNFWPP